MIEKFMKQLAIDRLIKKNDRVVVGVSGGPDSLVLLHLLNSIKETYNLEIFVAHIDHQFRGQDSVDDMNYVINYCKNIGVKCYARSVDVDSITSQLGISFEEAGRKVRYDLFHEVFETEKCNKIAVAQNLDDQAETVLMRLFRGAGLDGLSGIKLVRDEIIIRPLMRFTRSEIEAYCEKHDLKPRLDKTNLESIYTRNKIRLDLIPYLEKHFNPNLKKTIFRTAEILGEDLEFINSQVDQVWENIFKKTNDGWMVDLKVFNEAHVAIRKRLLRKSILLMIGNLKDVSSGQIEQIDRVCQENRTNTNVYVGPIRFHVEYGCLTVDQKTEVISKGFKHEFSMESLLEKSMNLDSKIYKDIRALIIHQDTEYLGEKEDEEIVGYFDYKYACGKVVVRSRVSGDKFHPKGMAGSKKIKDYFIDCKITKEKRDDIPLIIVNNEIIWVVGHRQSERSKVRKNTEQTLVLVVTKR